MVERAIAALSDHGHQVVVARSASQFARLAVTASDGYQFEVDLGVDWRAHQPVRLQVGPVLALPDAVANKVGALYSRAAARDFLDVDTIRQSERFTDNELLRLAVEHDPGFDPALFAEQLGQVTTLRASALTEYGVNPDDVQALQHRWTTWQRQILERQGNPPSNTNLGPEASDVPRTDPRRNPSRRHDRLPPEFTI